MGNTLLLRVAFQPCTLEDSRENDSRAEQKIAQRTCKSQRNRCRRRNSRRERRKKTLRPLHANFFLNSITRRQSQEELPARRSDREFNCKSQRNNYLAKTHAENLKRRNSTTMSLRVCIRRDKNRGQPKEKTRRRPRRRNDRGTHFQIAQKTLPQQRLTAKTLRHPSRIFPRILSTPCLRPADISQQITNKHTDPQGRRNHFADNEHPTRKRPNRRHNNQTHGNAHPPVN